MLGPKVYNQKRVKVKLKTQPGGSAVKSTNCSSEGPEFKS